MIDRSKKQRHTLRGLEKGDTATNLLKSGHPLLATVLGIFEARNRHPRPSSPAKIAAAGGATLFGLSTLSEPVMAAASEIFKAISQ